MTARFEFSKICLCCKLVVNAIELVVFNDFRRFSVVSSSLERPILYPRIFLQLFIEAQRNDERFHG